MEASTEEKGRVVLIACCACLKSDEVVEMKEHARSDEPTILINKTANSHVMTQASLVKTILRSYFLSQTLT